MSFKEESKIAENVQINVILDILPIFGERFQIFFLLSTLRFLVGQLYISSHTQRFKMLINENCIP